MQIKVCNVNAAFSIIKCDLSKHEYAMDNLNLSV